jgi:hypothetical protein
MIKTIKNGYADFSHEVENNNRKIIERYKAKNTSWAARIHDYESATMFKRSFFDFVENELEVNSVNKGDVLNLRDETVKRRRYSDIFDEYYLITNIDDNQMTIENYPTVAQAVKAQKKMNFVINKFPS